MWKTKADAFADGFAQGEARGREEAASRVAADKKCIHCDERQAVLCSLCAAHAGLHKASGS